MAAQPMLCLQVSYKFQILVAQTAWPKLRLWLCRIWQGTQQQMQGCVFSCVLLRLAKGIVIFNLYLTIFYIFAKNCKKLQLSIGKIFQREMIIGSCFRAALTWLVLSTMPVIAWASQDVFLRMEPVASTYLIEFSQGSELSKLAARYRMGGFETSGGQWVAFDKWYTPKWMDTRISWMTQVAPDLGVLWGFSTGEQAEKYRISPGLKMGFVYQTKLSLRSSFSVRATSMIGGRMTEKTCTANYGDIGGVEQVNCRLAATEMAPSQTLNYLTNALPPDRHNIWVTYAVHF